MVECFFYIERENEDEIDGIIRSLCVNCKVNKLPKDFPAWFYSGQIGPWTLKCNHCNDIIYLYEETQGTV